MSLTTSMQADLQPEHDMSKHIKHRHRPNARLRVLGINIDCISYQKMMERFDSWIQSGAGTAFSVALINVNCCVSALLDPRIRRVYQDADLRGLDSMPFLYL